MLCVDRTDPNAWNFRSTADLSHLPDTINTLGLGDLRMSGSASPSSEEQLKRLSQLWGERFHLVDLREEPHAMVDGHAVGWVAGKNWANLGKPRAEALAHERRLIEELRGQDNVTVSSWKDIKKANPDPLKVKLDGRRATGEASCVEAAGGGYTRLMVSNHLRPPDKEVDLFIGTVRELAPGTGLHIHCKEGRGRTMTVMVMYDMLHNARRVSAVDILARQAALQGSFKLEKAQGQASPKQFQMDRLAFLQAFHEYAKANPKGMPRTWSEWLG